MLLVCHNRRIQTNSDKVIVKGSMDNIAEVNAMANVIQGWLKIKTSNVTSRGGNLSCRK